MSTIKNFIKKVSLLSSAQRIDLIQEEWKKSPGKNQIEKEIKCFYEILFAHLRANNEGTKLGDELFETSL